jgi:hypothetical protein
MQSNQLGVVGHPFLFEFHTQDMAIMDKSGARLYCSMMQAGIAHTGICMYLYCFNGVFKYKFEMSKQLYLLITSLAVVMSAVGVLMLLR